MNVLMVTPSYFPIVGGAEAVVRDLSRELNSAGIHTDVMTLNMREKWFPVWKSESYEFGDTKLFRIPAVNVIPQSLHSERIMINLLRINVIPGRFRKLFKCYDVIHFHDSGDLTLPHYSYFVRKPRLLHLHGFHYELYKTHSLTRYVFKKLADIYVTPSRFIQNRLLDLGINVKKTKYIPNSVDTDQFCPRGPKSKDLLLFVGRITPSKGIHVLVDSLRYLRKPVRLAIAGPASPTGDEMRYFQEISRMISQENERGHHFVEYLGSKNRSELIDLYRRATALVLPSFYEGLPVTILEAMSCGTPVVATDVGGIPEMVITGENGFLVPRGDSMRLADRLEFILENDDIRLRQGHAARKLVLDEFSTNVVISRLRALYEELADREHSSMERLGPN